MRPQSPCLNLQKLPAVFLRPLLPQRLILHRQCLLRGPDKMRQSAANTLSARTTATITATSVTRVEAVEGVRQAEVGVVVEEDAVDGAIPGQFFDGAFWPLCSSKEVTDSFQRWSSRPTPEHSPRQQTYRG